MSFFLTKKIIKNQVSPQISPFLSLQNVEKFLKINERGDIFKERSV